MSPTSPSGPNRTPSKPWGLTPLDRIAAAAAAATAMQAQLEQEASSAAVSQLDSADAEGAALEAERAG